MKRIFGVVCLLLLGVCVGMGSASAQLRLTMDEALELALSENPTIKVAELEVERYDYVKRATWGNLLPQLSVDGNYMRSIVQQKMSESISFGADNTFTATGNLSLPLFAPAVYSTLKMNKIQAETAVESARSSKIELVAAVRKAFYNVLLAEQSLTVLLEAETTSKQVVDDTRLKFDNGLASEYDLLTAEVQLSNLMPTILQTRNSISVAELLLKMYLSIPEEVEIEAVGDLDAMRDAVLEGGEALSMDLSENSQLRTLDLQADVLRQSLRVANSSRMPTLAAFATATITGNDMTPPDFGSLMGGGVGTGQEPVATAAASRTFAAMATRASNGGSKFWWQHPISAGVQLSIPIFAGTTKQAQARSIRNQMAQLDLQRDYARVGVQVEVQTAINNLLTARETMFAQEKTVEQARKAYSISDTRYKAGAGTILELNSAQLAQTQAQLGYSQSIYDYLTAQTEYERIVGHGWYM